MKPKYWFSAHMHCKFSALVPHPSSSSSTRFLALDKGFCQLFIIYYRLFIIDYLLLIIYYFIISLLLFCFCLAFPFSFLVD